MKSDGLRTASLFEGSQKLKITKPIRLIELFGGIGSQAKALERLARVYSIPTAVKALCRKRAAELLIEVKGLEAERDDLVNFLEGWT